MANATIPYHLAILEQELERRRAKNSSYSLRAFAKSIDIDPAALSRVMTRKGSLSLKNAHRILVHLSLTDEGRTLFLESLGEDRKGRFLGKSGDATDNFTANEIDEDTFKVICDLYHYAILELTYLKGFKSEPRWIARKLGITAIEVEYAIARLIRLGLLTRDHGILRKTDRHISTKNKSLTTEAHKKHQTQVLNLAKQSLEQDPIERRNMTSVTMAIDKEKIPIAKKMIQNFMESLCQFLESGPRTEIFELGVCLYPITNGEAAK